MDAISSFGAVPLDIEKSNIDIFISSANKCLQGVPGFAFVIARNEVIDKCKGINSNISANYFYNLEVFVGFSLKVWKLDAGNNP